jgi:hypothetical protein
VVGATHSLSSSSRPLSPQLLHSPPPIARSSVPIRGATRDPGDRETSAAESRRLSKRRSAEVGERARKSSVRALSSLPHWRRRARAIAYLGGAGLFEGVRGKYGGGEGGGREHETMGARAGRRKTRALAPLCACCSSVVESAPAMRRSPHLDGSHRCVSLDLLEEREKAGKGGGESERGERAALHPSAASAARQAPPLASRAKQPPPPAKRQTKRETQPPPDNSAWFFFLQSNRQGKFRPPSDAPRASSSTRAPTSRRPRRQRADRVEAPLVARRPRAHAARQGPALALPGLGLWVVVFDGFGGGREGDRRSEEEDDKSDRGGGGGSGRPASRRTLKKKKNQTANPPSPDHPLSP